MEHVYCHMFPPACVFPSGLGNIPVTEIGGSPFPHGRVILGVGSEVWLRYFYQSLHTTVFVQTVFSTVVQGNSY